MNRPHDENLTAKLLDLDADTAPTSREAYERGMTELFERRLTKADWARLAVMLVGGLAGAVVCGSLAFSEPAETPPRTRAILAIFALIGLSWVGLAGVIFRRGAINSRVHGAAAATMGFAFSLIVTAIVAVMAMTQRTGFSLILLPIVPLVLASIVLIVHHIRQSELRLRRDLLSIGYRIASARRDA